MWQILCVVLLALVVLATGDSSCCLRGPRGATGKPGIPGTQGPTGPAGPPGTLEALTVEILDESGAISSSINVTEIVSYDYDASPLPFVLLQGPVASNKYVLTANDAVVPSSIGTSDYGITGVTAFRRRYEQFWFVDQIWRDLKYQYDQNTWYVQRFSARITQDAPEFFGTAVALSAEGTTAAIGSPGLSGNGGTAVYVLDRPNNAWTKQAQLVGTGIVSVSGQGQYSVRLSGDGNTLAVGGPNDNVGVGATWVFTRTGTSWSQQGSKLIGSGGGTRQGTALGLSTSGDTLGIGSPLPAPGRVYVFTRSAGVWTQQAILTDPALSATPQLGVSVAVSCNGDTLAAGAPGNFAGGFAIGAVSIFVRDGSSWSVQDTLTATSGGVSDQFGTGVALSCDGSVLVASAPGCEDPPSLGCVYVFTRSSVGVWTIMPAMPLVLSPSYDFHLGGPVDESKDGTEIAATGVANGAGTFSIVFVWTRNGDTWTLSSLVGPPDADPNVVFGTSIAFNADGRMLLVGEPEPNGLGTTNAYVFA